LETIDQIIKQDNDSLLEQLEALKRNALKARHELINGEFRQLKNPEDKDERINYIIQFIPLIRFVVFYPDDELFEKLRGYGFSKTVLKWFTPIEKITDELIELRKMDGVFFVLNSYLFAVTAYIETKIVVEIVESFDLHVRHGKDEESNILHKNYDNLIRRREYNRSKGQKGKVDFGDSIIYHLIGSIEKQVKDEFDFKKMLLDASKGEFEQSKEFFQAFFAPEISKSKVYSALFPLLKLTYKDKELLSQEEFDDLEEVIYGGSYYKYKTARVKKILLKK